MKTKTLFLSSLTLAVWVSAVAQQAGGQAPPAPSAPGAAQVPPAPGQVPPNPTAPPGLNNREQLPPGLRNRDQLPPGLANRQFGSVTNRVAGVNTNGVMTNQFGITNQFGLTNQFGTNQFGGLTNRFGITNRFGVNPPGLTNRLLPTGSVSNRVFGTNIPGRVGLSNAFGTNALGQGMTPADRALLTQVQQVLQPILSPTGVAMPVRALTREGVVTLVGVVPSLQQSQQIEAVVAQIPGVVRINNRLAVNPNPNPTVLNPNPNPNPNTPITPEGVIGTNTPANP
jgi:hypothetical protein